jgi:hypothetical protein
MLCSDSQTIVSYCSRTSQSTFHLRDVTYRDGQGTKVHSLLPGPLQQFWDDSKAHHGIKLVVDKGQNAIHVHVILNLTKGNDLCFHMYCSFLNEGLLVPHSSRTRDSDTDKMLCKSVAFWPLIFRGVPEKRSRKSESLEEISSQCETSGSHGGMEIRAFWDVAPCSRSRQTF